MTLSVSRGHLAVGGFLFLVVLAGCLSMSVEMTVDSDGQIEEAELELEFEDEFVFNAFQDEASEEGFDTVGEWIAADMEDDGDWGSVEAETDEDEQTVRITASDGDPDTMDDINVTVDEEADEVTFVDRDGLEQEEGFDNGGFGDADEIELVYIVNMPGDIIDTNGEIRDDGTSVEWSTDMDEEVDQLEATSERTGADDGFGPGFGVGAIVAALLAVGALVGLRRRR